jgi:hypothetical protein
MSCSSSSRSRSHLGWWAAAWARRRPGKRRARRLQRRGRRRCCAGARETARRGEHRRLRSGLLRPRAVVHRRQRVAPARARNAVGCTAGGRRTWLIQEAPLNALTSVRHPLLRDLEAASETSRPPERSARAKRRPHDGKTPADGTTFAVQMPGRRAGLPNHQDEDRSRSAGRCRVERIRPA